MGINQIQGGEVKSNIARALYSKEENVEGFSGIIQPVIEVNKKYNNIYKKVGTSGTIYITPEDRDFFLTYLKTGLSVVAGTVTTVNSKITFVLEDGETQDFRIETLRDPNNAVYLSEGFNFGNGIKIKRGSSIILSSVAVNSTNGFICGFEERVM